MNIRIQKLAEQAGLEFDDNLVLESEPIYYTTQKDLEKFAMLIVRECSSVVASVLPCHGDYRDQIEKNMRDYCAQKVLEHFEVEK